MVIGKTESDKPFVLPADLVTSTMIVYGGKGMGKTNFGDVLVEELSRAGLRWAALDPMGVWWGLRHSKDGKGPGVECLILGGPHGDIPIEPTGGAVAADLVADESVNVIIDFSRKPNGETWGVGEKIRFVTDYGRRLFQRQGSLISGQRREPIFQVLDEAARYIPQMIRAGQPELAMCVSVWAQIVEEGRNNGIGVCLLTQRSARLNKDVAELADAMCAFRTVGPNSIDAVMDWLGEHIPREQIRKHVETVRSLPVGSCLFVSPGWLQFEGIVRIRERETFDSSATPKPGERTRKVTGAAARPDLEKYAERMRDTIERAKENDPQELKRRISDLSRQLDAAKREKPGAQVATADQVNDAIARRDVEWNNALRNYEDRIVTAIKTSVGSFISPARDMVGGIIANARDAASAAFAKELFQKPAGTTIFYARKRTVADVPSPSTVNETRRGFMPPKARYESNGSLSQPQLRILSALAQFEALGRTAISKKWIAALAGASHTSSAYGNNLGALRSKGYIDYPGAGMAALTDAGRAQAPAVQTPATAEDMLARCEEIVTNPQSAILAVLASAYPEDLAKAELADRAGASATSSAFGNNLGALRSAGMIEYPAPGKVKLASWVMLDG